MNVADDSNVFLNSTAILGILISLVLSREQRVRVVFRKSFSIPKKIVEVSYLDFSRKLHNGKFPRVFRARNAVVTFSVRIHDNLYRRIFQ